MISALLAYPNGKHRDRILQSLTEEAGITLAGDCVYGDDALAKIESLRPDVVFASTEVLNLSSLSAASWPGLPKHPHIIVLSDCDKYAADAFAINAVDYLLMPLDKDRFKASIGRLRRTIEADQILDRRLDLDTLAHYLKDYIGKAAPTHRDERVLINFGGRMRVLSTHNIRYLQANGHHVDIHMTTGEVLHSTSRVAEIGAKLPADRFLRIRRSTIVNIEHICEARARKENYEIVMDDNTTFRPGTTYKFKVRAALVKRLQHMSGSPADPLELALKAH